MKKTLRSNKNSKLNKITLGLGLWATLASSGTWADDNTSQVNVRVSPTEVTLDGSTTIGNSRVGLHLTPQQISLDSNLLLGFSPISFQFSAQKTADNAIQVTEDVNLNLSPKTIGSLVGALTDVNATLAVDVSSSQTVQISNPNGVNAPESSDKTAQDLLNRVLFPSSGSILPPLQVNLNETLKVDISSQVSGQIPEGIPATLDPTVGASGHWTLIINRTQSNRAEIYITGDEALFTSLGLSEGLESLKIPVASMAQFISGLTSVFNVDAGASVSNHRVVGFILDPSNEQDWKAFAGWIWNFMIPQNWSKGASFAPTINYAKGAPSDFKILQIGQKKETEAHVKIGASLGSLFSFNLNDKISSDHIQQQSGPQAVKTDATVEAFSQQVNASIGGNNVKGALTGDKEMISIYGSVAQSGNTTGPLERLIFKSSSTLKAQAHYDLSEQVKSLLLQFQNWIVQLDLSGLVPNINIPIASAQVDFTMAIDLALLETIAEDMVNKGQLQSAALGGGINPNYISQKISEATKAMTGSNQNVLTQAETSVLAGQLGALFGQLHFQKRGDSDNLTMVSVRNKVRVLCLNPLSTKVLPTLLYRLGAEADKDQYESHLYLKISSQAGSNPAQSQEIGVAPLSQNIPDL